MNNEVLIVGDNADSGEIVVDNSLHPMVRGLMQGDKLDPANIEKLLDIQQRYERDQARKAYAAAIAEFRGIVPQITRDAKVGYEHKNGGGSTEYRHETLDHIMQTISETLEACKLAPTFHVEDHGDNLVKVTCRITHALGHYEETSLSSLPDNSGKKNSIQAKGSAITYLQRYTLKALLGLSVAHDDDGAAANVGSPISEEQLAKIMDLVGQKNKDPNRLLKWVKTKVPGIQSFAELPAERFDWLIGALEK